MSSAQTTMDNFIDRLNSDFSLIDQSTTTERTTTRRVERLDEYKLEKVHMNDLYNALRYTLLNEVTTHQVLNSTTLSVLKNYTKILSKYFPFDNEETKSLISKLSKWFEDQSNEVKIEDYIAQVNEEALPFKTYEACRGSVAGYRGNPCSMWLMFHVMAANEFVANGLKVDHQVLFAMRGYIKHFFSCKHCADHFVKMSKDMSSELDRHPGSSMLWLWKKHNVVNARLKGDETEDPFHPKIQFPSMLMCPRCYRRGDEWNEKEVLNFLINHYKNGNINHSKSMLKSV